MTILALFASGLAMAAAPGEGFDGVWKISRPQSAFVPTDGPIPFTPEGRKAYEEHRASLAKGDFSFDYTQSRCSLPGVPRMSLTPMPFRIWVQPRTVVFEYEWNRQFRTIDMVQPRSLKFEDEWNRVIRVAPGTELNKPLVGVALGIGQGHWEGQTLIIQSRYFIDHTLIDNLVPHDFDMVVDEHWRLLDRNTLVDEITITDPAFFTRPWHTRVSYQRQPDTDFAEDVCLDRRDAGQMPLPLTADDKLQQQDARVKARQ